MRCLLSGITAFKEADGRAAEYAPVESALVLNSDLNEDQTGFAVQTIQGSSPGCTGSFKSTS